MPKAFAPPESRLSRMSDLCEAALSGAGTALATAAAVLLVGPLQEAGAQTRGSSGGGIGSGVSSGVGSGLSRGGLSGAGALSTGVGRFSSPARGSIAPTVPSRGALPPSAIGAPAPRVPGVAPLAPPAASTFLGSGTTTITTPGGISTNVPSAAGTVQTFPGGGGSRAATGGSGLLSGTAGFLPSQAPSTPGGGAEGVKACMGFWDAGTHMTKREWAAACRRVQTRLEGLQKDLDKARSSEGGTGRTARARNR